MKTIRFYTALTLAALLLAACGGGGDSAEPVAPKTYTLDPVTLTAASGTRTVSMPAAMTSPIASAQSSATWLTVEPQSGAVKLSWTENTTYSQRNCNVTVTSTTGDKVFINVSQEGRPTDESSSTHDNTTDQPAYAPLR